MVCVTALELSSPGMGLVHCPLTGTYNSADQYSRVLSIPFESKDGEPGESLLSLSRWVVGPGWEPEAPLKYLSKQPLIPGNENMF